MKIPIDQAIQMYEAGESLRALAPLCGLSSQTVARRLQQHGVKLRGRAKTALIRQKLSAARTIQIDETTLRSLHQQQLSTREIAAALPGNPSEECVRERMVALGLSRLPAKARMHRNYFWAGGYHVDKAGYILVKYPDHPHRTHKGYVRLHRIVMEQTLGRLLLQHEVVDHINGDTSDNRPENLRLFDRNSAHLRETLRGKRKLPAPERERLRLLAVQRARLRVEAILKESETGAHPSP